MVDDGMSDIPSNKLVYKTQAILKNSCFLFIVFLSQECGKVNGRI